jgi:SH3 domain protein
MVGRSRRRARNRRYAVNTCAGRVAGLLALGTALALVAGSAYAETAWVKDHLRLNLRAGPGIEYRIIGAIETGDSVDVLERVEGWTKVRAQGVEEGWIPEGYLQEEAPAQLALAKHEAKAAELQEQLATLTSETEQLRSESSSVAGRDGEQKAKIAELTQENLRLRAGARWPEWIAGASLLAAGMLLGAILYRNATRRPGPRIRL